MLREVLTKINRFLSKHPRLFGLTKRLSCLSKN
jgi:hypothetical protein